MTLRALIAFASLLLSTTGVEAQRAATAAEIKQAQSDTPHIADVLELKPGMAVADVGAGFGAMSIVLARWLGPSGRLFATDITEAALTALREAKTREDLATLTVVEGAERSTNLPDACCDAILVRHVYHHVTQPADFNRSLFAALRPGGRLAIIDFAPQPGSELPQGVAANRGGHGIVSDLVVSEVVSSGLTHARTVSKWPPNANPAEYFLVLFTKP